jgi:hypothetical protein
VLADEEADPAAEGDATQADGARVAERRRQTVGGRGGGVLAGRQPGLGPGEAPRRVDVEAFMGDRSMTTPPSTVPWPARL